MLNNLNEIVLSEGLDLPKLFAQSKLHVDSYINRRPQLWECYINNQTVIAVKV